jgi:hypothetical protein
MTLGKGSKGGVPTCGEDEADIAAHSQIRVSSFVQGSQWNGLRSYHSKRGTYFRSFLSFFPQKGLSGRRHNTQPNDTQHNDIQDNDTEQNSIECRYTLCLMSNFYCHAE